MRWNICGIALLGFSLSAMAGDPLTVKVMLRPAPEPKPALRYQLLPPDHELTTGNAALGYHRAMSPEFYRSIFSPEQSKVMEPWDALTPKQIPIDEVKTFILTVRGPLNELDHASRRSRCEWDLDDRLGQDGIALLLPELQGMRTLARVLRLRSKLEIAEGRFEDAIKTCQTGIALGHHLCDGPTLIHSLVGIAVTSIFLTAVDELIDAPKSPNMYWALSALPRPMASLRKPMGGEMRTINGLFPPLDRLEKGVLTKEDANRLLDECLNKLAMLGDVGLGKPFGNRTMMATYVTVMYPQAKKSLVARGRTPEEVELMPVAQVVMLAATLDFTELRDDVMKWITLPYPDALPHMRKSEARIKELKASGTNDLGTSLFMLLVPAIEKVSFAAVRTDRRIAMLRVVEAIRLHLVESKGKLPEKLEDITVVPVPLDPVTGKPFQYAVAENKITLTGPAPVGEQVNTGTSVVYELFLEP